MTQEERIELTKAAVEYEPPIDEIKAKYDRLIAERQPVDAKICDAKGTLVGYIRYGIAYIGSWVYNADESIFKRWVELNNVTVIYSK